MLFNKPTSTCTHLHCASSCSLVYETAKVPFHTLVQYHAHVILWVQSLNNKAVVIELLITCLSHELC